MNRNDASLEEIERRAYLSTFEDGIYDILLGLLFLIFALVPVLERVGISRYVGYFLMVVPAVLAWPVKRYLTIPRLGAVEFGARRKKRQWVALAVGLVVLLLTVPLVLLIGSGELSGVLGWKLVALLAAPLLVLAFYSLQLTRLLVYVALLMCSILETEILLGTVGSPFNAILGFGLPGAVITAIGISLLIRFVRAHPVKETEYAG